MVNTLLIKSKIGEEIVYRRDVKEGFWKPKVVSAFLVTNYRVISPDGRMLWYEEIDDVVSINEHRESQGGFRAISTRGSAFRYTMGTTGNKSMKLGDVHFISSKRHDLTWQVVPDPSSLVRLIKSLKKQREVRK